MMQLSQAEGGEKVGLPSLAPASALGEYMQGDVTEFSPNGALVAVVTNASKTLRYARKPERTHRCLPVLTFINPTCPRLIQHLQGGGG